MSATWYRPPKNLSLCLISNLFGARLLTWGRHQIGRLPEDGVDGQKRIRYSSSQSTVFCYAKKTLYTLDYTRLQCEKADLEKVDGII